MAIERLLLQNVGSGSPVGVSANPGGSPARTIRGETRPALPLVAVLARISLDIALREANSEDPVNRTRQAGEMETADLDAHRYSRSVSRLAKVHDEQSTGIIKLVRTSVAGRLQPMRLATPRPSEGDASLTKRLTSVTRSGDGS